MVAVGVVVGGVVVVAGSVVDSVDYCRWLRIHFLFVNIWEKVLVGCVRRNVDRV